MLIALIGAIGYGGWSVLNEVQRVQVAPVENTPDVLADLDPLEAEQPGQGTNLTLAGNFAAPEDETLDRLYRPEALDVPVMVARDAPPHFSCKSLSLECPCRQVCSCGPNPAQSLRIPSSGDQVLCPTIRRGGGLLSNARPSRYRA